MTALAILAIYLFLGLVSGILVLLRPQAVSLSLPRALAAMLAVLLWPFLLPTLLPSEDTAETARPGTGERAQRLESAAQRLGEAWRRSGWKPSGDGPARERAMLDRFVARLRENEARLSEMEHALTDAPPSIRERLARLRDAGLAELDQGIHLLDELAAQLTLLQYADLASPGGTRVERGHLEELLARIEALAEVNTA